MVKLWLGSSVAWLHTELRGLAERGSMDADLLQIADGSMDADGSWQHDHDQIADGSMDADVAKFATIPMLHRWI